MSLGSEITESRICNSLRQKQKELLIEMQDILKECDIEWNDNYINHKDFSPPFEYGNEDNEKWFYIILGKYIIIDEIYKLV